MSTMGKPARMPLVMASVIPWSTEGMYSFGMRPPEIWSANS